jgi:hypothetical protein
MKFTVMILSTFALSASAVPAPAPIPTPAPAVAPITFNSLILVKSTTATDWEVYSHRTLDLFCRGLARAAEVESFQAAKDLDALPDGTYTCSGEFVAIPGDRPMKIFSLGQCQAAPNLKKSCPP